MKKYLTLWLCLCFFYALAVFAAASENSPDYYAEYVRIHGAPPSATDFTTNEEYSEVYNTWLADFERFVNWRTAERARMTEEASVFESIPTTPNESTGVKNANGLSASLLTGSVDEHPARARVDLAGNVYSLDGKLLSPGTTPAAAPDEDDALSSDHVSDPTDASSVSDVDTLAVIAGLVSDIATDQPVFTIRDLRSANPPAEVLTGMKALVTSIFGEYTPVTTTTVISETVGNDTQQYLVDAVAPGAAGIDYEWVAGVVLFAIMLYCLMRLLGGILK